MSGNLSLKTFDGQTHNFKSGYDLWVWAAFHRPSWLLSEKLTDRREINDIIQNAKK